MGGFASWIGQSKRVYFGNAAATRDLRVQLRGSRAVVLFTLYLVIMGLVLGFVYSDATRYGRITSLATAQSSLQSFYYTTLGCLAAVISLVAPAVGAFSIVLEKQRRSLDLVFSAPVSPRYYLVGKLISAYRYVWLLLVLSLPYCAVSVSLGGATWTQLFVTFLLFSFYGLVCVSIGLLFSALCQKTIPALIWSYISVAAYVSLTGFLLATTAATGGGMNPFISMSPASVLCPVSFPMIGSQVFDVLGLKIPLWIVSIVEHLIVVKIIILGAGTLLEPGDKKMIANLRIHGLIYGSIMFAYYGFSMIWVIQQMLTYSSSVRVADVAGLYYGRSFFWMVAVLGFFLVSYLATFATADLRRYRPDGIWKLRETFSGRPSGNLPYLMLFFVVCLVSYCAVLIKYGAGGVATQVTYTESVARAAGSSAPLPPTTTTIPINLDLSSWNFWQNVLLVLAFWLLPFFIGFLACSTKPVLARGRGFATFSILLGVVLPSITFMMVSPEQHQEAAGLWMISPLSSLVSMPEYSRIGTTHMLAMMALAAIFAYFAHRNIRTLISKTPQQGNP